MLISWSKSSFTYIHLSTVEGGQYGVPISFYSIKNMLFPFYSPKKFNFPFYKQKGQLDSHPPPLRSMANCWEAFPFYNFVKTSFPFYRLTIFQLKWPFSTLRFTYCPPHCTEALPQMAKFKHGYLHFLHHLNEKVHNL